ncbi:MAG: hypothetical protein JWN78_685 [Bacteroidota bacterium]|nr:hypothetical protein [Bacteroidota bacterium]
MNLHGNYINSHGNYVNVLQITLNINKLFIKIIFNKNFVVETMTGCLLRKFAFEIIDGADIHHIGAVLFCNKIRNPITPVDEIKHFLQD